MKIQTNFIKYIIFSLFLFNCSTKIEKTSAFLQAQKFTDNKDYSASIKLLNKIILQYPKFDSAYVERGFAKSNNGDYESAILDFNKAIKINYTNIGAYFSRASAYGGLQDFDSALKDYNQIIRLGSSDYYVYALLERTIIFDYWGQYDDAINDYNKILKIDSLNCEVLAGLGVLYYSRKNDFENGLVYLNTVVEKCPDYADGYYKRGNLFDHQMKYDSALNDYNRAIELNPNIDNYYLRRGLVFRSLNKIKNAIKDLNFAISLNPNNGYVYINRGYIKEQELNDIKGANEDFKKAKELGID